MFVLPPLPYSPSDLEPYISEKTFSFHYSKHHNAYVTKLNELSQGTKFAEMPLVDVILESHKDGQVAIFNNSAQVWNHDFFWKSMKKNGGGKPSGEVLKNIEDSFGSYEEFASQFKNNGLGQFGSGWVWLVKEKSTSKLKVVKTSNADTPLTDPSVIPLATADVWEHSYYIDYQNRRMDYLDIFLKNLINWDFVSSNMGV